MQVNTRQINDWIIKKKRKRKSPKTKQTFLKRRHKDETNTWEVTQHNSLSEKYKSKPQCGAISHWSGWLPSKSLQVINTGVGVKKREPSYTVGQGGLHLVWRLQRTVWRCLKRWEIGLPYDSATPLLGIHNRVIRIERYVLQCWLDKCLQYVGRGSTLDVHQLMNGQESCSTYTQWIIAQL